MLYAFLQPPLMVMRCLQNRGRCTGWASQRCAECVPVERHAYPIRYDMAYQGLGQVDQ